jgi:hypothetical protein
MSLKNLISNPYWTSRIHFNFGYVPVKKIVLNCHGGGQENMVSWEKYREEIEKEMFGLKMVNEYYLDEYYMDGYEE